MKRLFLAGAVALASACASDVIAPPPSGTPAQLSMGIQPSASVTSGLALPTQPTVRLRDTDGKLVAQSGVVVTASVGSGAALANGAATTDGTGTASFTGLTVTGLAGSYVLHFSATGLTGVDAAPLALAAGAPSRLAIVTAPSASAQAGAPLATPPAIQLRDVSGNAAARAGVTITASVVGGTVTNATAATSASGVATFTGLTLSGLAGAYTLRFSATGLLGVDAAAATVISAGPATQLALATQPSAAAVNGAVLATQPVVEQRDAYGNPVAAQSGIRVVANVVSGPPGSSIAGDTAFSDSTGKATFSGLKITGAVGNYALRFASSPLASVVSAPATVLSPSGATQLTVFRQPPNNAVNGTALGVQPVIQLGDQSANAVPQAGVVVTAAIQSGSGTLANATATTDSAGKASFSGLTITGTAGAFQLRFSAPPLTAVSALATLLAPGAATQLSLTVQPATTATSGAVLSRQPVVQLRDMSGNAVPQGNVVVTASVVGGGATASGDTMNTGTNGTATFTALAINGAGTHTLRFSAGSLTPVDAAAPTTVSP